MDNPEQSMWAIIVVCWNNETLLADCLDSIRAQTIGGDRIVTIMVDNDSSDDSVAFVRKNYPEVNLIEVGYNSGFSAPTIWESATRFKTRGSPAS